MADNKKVVEDKRLPFDVLFQESGDSLPIFVGVITDMGLLKEYKENVEKHKKGKKLKPLMTLEDYNKAKHEFLNRKVF